MSFEEYPALISVGPKGKVIDQAQFYTMPGIILLEQSGMAHIWVIAPNLGQLQISNLGQ